MPMRLKPRLSALAELVPQGSVVADIGTDHAFLPIYLVMQGLADKVIAVENRPTTLEQARRSLNLFNCTHRIDLRLGYGLNPIQQDDGVDVVVIAGLGGRSICRILLAGRDKWDWFQSLILQPMQDSPLLRRWLLAHGMSLSSERLVREGQRIYEILMVRRGRQQVFDPLLFELGPCLIQQRDPLLVPFIHQKMNRCRAIAEAMQESGRPENRLKQNFYLEQECRLKEVLELVGDDQDHCRLS
jgi:tRNA (adenine22-N1)-methyltransferase